MSTLCYCYRKEEQGPPIEELKQVDKQVLAEETRARLPGKSPQELNFFCPDTFSNVGLYNFISIHAGQVVREAYRLATQLAPQAELRPFPRCRPESFRE